MILGWFAIAKDNCITTDNHKANRMQSPNHRWHSRVPGRYIVNLIRHG